MIHNSWFRQAAAIAVFAMLVGEAYAVNDVLTLWTFEDPNVPPVLNNSATSPIVNATSGTGTASGVHASAATDWSNPVGNGSTESFSSNNWAVNDYWQLDTNTLSATNSNIGFIFDHYGSNTGPRDFQLQVNTGSGYTDFGLPYMIGPVSDWSGNPSNIVINGRSTYAFDLSSVPGIFNSANVSFRLVNVTGDAIRGDATATTGTNRIDNVQVVENFSLAALPSEVGPSPAPVLPAAGDVAFGLGRTATSITAEMIRGSATLDGGNKQSSPWIRTSIITSVEFDNKGGTLHNIQGNLLAVETGGNPENGGRIYSMATQGDPASFPAGQLIGNTVSTGSIGHAQNDLTNTRLSGLSVAPNNSKIAVAGFDTGKVLVYDYEAGNSEGSGASLSAGRETAAFLTPAVQATGTDYRYGTTWLDDNTVLAMNRDGQLTKVDASTMATTTGPTLTVSGVGSDHTALYYNPQVSDYVYAMYSGFSGGAFNELFLLDPVTLAVEASKSFAGSLSADSRSAREISLDAEGNLFISTDNSNIYVVPDVEADLMNIPEALHWYVTTSGSTWNGIDVGLAGAAVPDADYNGDGSVDAADYVLWRKNPGAFGGDPAGYDAWHQQFGQSADPGDVAQVPEPATLAMLAVVLAAFGLTRRRD